MTHGSRAASRVYLTIETQEQYEWDDFIGTIRDVVRRKYPSMDECETWEYRECHGIMRNQHATVFVSEYNGIVAVELVGDDSTILGQAWAGQVSDGFYNAVSKVYKGAVLYSQGSASNGEQMFTIADKPGSCVTSKEGRLW